MDWKGREARCQGGQKKALDESGGDEPAKVMGEAAEKTARRDDAAACENDGANGKFVGQHAERQVGQRNPKDHCGDGHGGGAFVDLKFVLQNGQHRLCDIDRRKGRRYQSKHRRL